MQTSRTFAHKTCTLTWPCQTSLQKNRAFSVQDFATMLQDHDVYKKQLMKVSNTPLVQKILISCPKTTKTKMGLHVAAATALKLPHSSVATPVTRYILIKHSTCSWGDVQQTSLLQSLKACLVCTRKTEYNILPECRMHARMYAQVRASVGTTLTQAAKGVVVLILQGLTCSRQPH